MALLIRLNTAPDERTLRQFGVIALVVFGVLAILVRTERAVLGLDLGPAYAPMLVIFSGLAVFSLACSLVYPPGNRALFVALQVVGYPIGLIVSYVMLGVLFFVVLGLTAVFLRLIGRTPIRLSYDSSARSYWVTARRNKSNDGYFRQF